MGFQKVVSGAAVDEATAGREHCVALGRDESRQHLVLETSIVALAVEREDLVEPEARLLLDELVELDERAAERGGELGADRALSRAPQADESYDMAVVFESHELVERGSERPAELV